MLLVRRLPLLPDILDRSGCLSREKDLVASPLYMVRAIPFCRPIDNAPHRRLLLPQPLPRPPPLSMPPLHLRSVTGSGGAELGPQRHAVPVDVLASRLQPPRRPYAYRWHPPSLARVVHVTSAWSAPKPSQGVAQASCRSAST